MVHPPQQKRKFNRRKGVKTLFWNEGGGDMMVLKLVVNTGFTNR